MLLFRIWSYGKLWLGVRKSKRSWFTVERFSVHQENLLFVPERGSVLRSWLGPLKQEHQDFDQELCRNDGSFEQTAALPRTASSDLTRPLTPDPVLPCASYPRSDTTGFCEGDTGTRIVTGFQKASCPLRTPVLS